MLERLFSTHCSQNREELVKNVKLKGNLFKSCTLGRLYKGPEASYPDITEEWEGQQEVGLLDNDLFNGVETEEGIL